MRRLPSPVLLALLAGSLATSPVYSTPPHPRNEAEESERSPAAEIPNAITVSELEQVKRLCIEDFDGGENARQLRAILIDHIHRLGAFTITENPRKADAFLRGFAEDLVYREQFSRDENVTARGSGSVSTGGYTRNRASSSQSVGGSASTRDRAEVRRHEASLTVRIVNTEGDVLWSGSSESKGGKFRSASADVAEKVAQQLRKRLQLADGEQ